MENLEDVHFKFKTNMLNFLKLLEMILVHVKTGIENDCIKTGEDTKMIENVITNYDPSVIIGFMQVMVETSEMGDLLERFAVTYHKYWDELFSGECGLEFFQDKFSMLFGAANVDNQLKNSTFVGPKGKKQNENDNNPSNSIMDFMNEMLQLKDLNGNFFITEDYINRIIQYFRSFSRSSIKHLFVLRKPFKRVKVNESEHYKYLFKNNQLCPEVDISKCLFFYNIDVSMLVDLK
jgi:hypothetical protein